MSCRPSSATNGPNRIEFATTPPSVIVSDGNWLGVAPRPPSRELLRVDRLPAARFETSLEPAVIERLTNDLAMPKGVSIQTRRITSPPRAW